MSALHETKGAELAKPVPMERQASILSLQHQTKLRLTRAAWLVAASLKQLQDWSASCRAGVAGNTNSGPNNCAGFPRRLSHSHWLGISSLTSHRRSVWTSLGAGRLQLPVRAIRRSARLFHSTQDRGANRLLRHTLPAEQFLQSLAHRNHHSSRLSSSAVLAGFQTSEALNGRVPKTIGAFHKNEGELPNVGS